jgi:hypothetical protein
VFAPARVQGPNPIPEPGTLRDPPDGTRRPPAPEGGGGLEEPTFDPLGLRDSTGADPPVDHRGPKIGIDAQEAVDRADGEERVPPGILEQRDQDLLAGEEIEIATQVERVSAAVHVLGMRWERLAEPRCRINGAGDDVVEVAGERAVGRMPKRDDQPGVGVTLANPSRGLAVSQIRCRELAGDRALRTLAEDALVPLGAPVPVRSAAEEVDLLLRHADLGMLVQAGVDPRSAGSLGPDPDEIGASPRGVCSRTRC